MRRIRLFVLFLSISTIFASLPAVGAVKAGATCPRAGKVAVKSGNEFRCVKKGKKLVWVKGLKRLAAPIPSVSPTPSPSPTPAPSSTQSPAPSPTQTAEATPTPEPTVFIPPAIPTSFKDLEKNADGVSYAAWLKSKSAIEVGKSKLGKLEIFIGPNSGSINTSGSTSLQDLSRMFSRFAEPKENYVLIYGLKDIEWANKKVAELVTAEELRILQLNEGERLIESNCPRLCTNAKQQTAKQSMKSLILIGSDYFSLQHQIGFEKFKDKSIWLHEYFHAIQRIPLLTSGRNLSRLDWPPTWFSEGTASYVENGAQNFESYEDYLKMRRIRSIGQAVDEAWFLDFLDEKHLGERWSSFGNIGIYEVGMRIVEILVSIKGPESLMEMYSEMAQGVGFLRAFENVYGVQWSEARPIMAKVLAIQHGPNR